MTNHMNIRMTIIISIESLPFGFMTHHFLVDSSRLGSEMPLRNIDFCAEIGTCYLENIGETTLLTYRELQTRLEVYFRAILVLLRSLCTALSLLHVLLLLDYSFFYIVQPLHELSHQKLQPFSFLQNIIEKSSWERTGRK